MKKIILVTVLVALLVTCWFLFLQPRYISSEDTGHDEDFLVLKNDGSPVTGTIVWKNEEGFVYRKTQYKNGLEHGTSKGTYLFTGNLQYKIEYGEGEKHGKSIWYQNKSGLVDYGELYENGKFVRYLTLEEMY